MPELPDVEGFRRVLDSCVRGRSIERVEVADPGVLREVTPWRLERALVGRCFAEPRRHGKWLIAATDGPVVLLHFGMTGSLVCCSPADPLGRHDRVAFVAGERQLRYRDQRKLQGIRLVADQDGVRRALSELGPDALDVGPAEFDELIDGRRARIKAVLMDQSVLAGLGNLLADEILWRARVAPDRQAAGLAAEERRRIHRAMRRVLRDSVRVGHIPAGSTWLTGRRDSPDPACPRCGTRLRRGRITGRTTLWCPHCQGEGQALSGAAGVPAVEQDPSDDPGRE
ncbi:Fpg/Nei family DNA glycosylase [Streptantibioticus ferralitis]|uniref:Fpg/Nei family DNA glycosylase n=1 Tax=Streptantibioticus ferralitis TaxID=236510 RepID=A0ABT5ZAF8_9ACTN|nr:DNA-formamidopyrimidine glycosylase family protein [Streptantibioticus ferralitis]MDF2260831.1 Fpg/Nei family DNA glycosylase [Streptantibioticus ferralitis]